MNPLLPLPLPTPPPGLRPAPQLFGWGLGDAGQLGLSLDLAENIPIIRKPRCNRYVEQKMAENALGGVGAGLETVAAGGMHSLMVDETGTVWSCGANDNAALGRVTIHTTDPAEPSRILEIDESTHLPNTVPVPIQSLVNERFRAVKVVAGDSISAAISDTGALRVWGTFRGEQGPVGFSPNTMHQFTPTLLPALAGVKIVAAAAGNDHLLLLTAQGSVYTMGSGAHGQLGRRVLDWHRAHGTAPRRIVLGRVTQPAVAVGAGENHAFAVDAAGTVWGWGINARGQTGTGYRGAADQVVAAPRRVRRLDRAALGGATVVQIAGGSHHTLFRTSDGRVYACGIADEGQLGLADDDPAFADRAFPGFLPEPARVAFPDADDPVVHIACGTNNNLAITRDGAMYAWGRQVVGELGLGHDEDVKTPTVVVRRVGNSWAAVDAACAGQHALALLRRRT
ncbi:hypothetical protein POSPLADRAFT_1128891 [Postia placenta MAD-698-R-SB12]|uniref:RCC1-like domain-containing protein n=1 Tax=Postia placenta MAD-698-R-SB12 TaxID=670580 RepID=A0A1X6NDT8_9APHY|nr:hypothetical protein POSPLADRAFT_1128891 [Postia placenta MAD-698-R-SB12]OSX66809.1 hypothetical protein POSPLADRAFT_1128891 [Postia placenta MAD-698-R-SB12]